MTGDTHFRSFFIPLLVMFLAGTALLVTVNTFTHEKIAKNASDRELRIIDTVMPLPHDNDLHEDAIKLADPGNPGNGVMTVYRARRDGHPVGAVLMPVTAAGYSGTVLLVIGIARDGTLLGVNILKHRETPGLGDRIEPGKSGWINQFSGRVLKENAVADWAVKADGGKFDQLSGATITSRGVVNAVRKALEFYQADRDRIYSE